MNREKFKCGTSGYNSRKLLRVLLLPLEMLLILPNFDEDIKLKHCLICDYVMK